MCSFLSAIISRSGEVYCNPMLDSHNDIAEFFGLSKDTGQKWTPIEFVPKDIFDPETWEFRFDAERPTWADAEWLESATQVMVKRAKALIVKEERKVLVGGAYIFAKGAKPMTLDDAWRWANVPDRIGRKISRDELAELLDPECKANDDATYTVEQVETAIAGIGFDTPDAKPPKRYEREYQRREALEEQGI